MKKIIYFVILLVLVIFLSGCVAPKEQKPAQKETFISSGDEGIDDISHTGTGSCTERGECEKLLGKGAFCSYNKCFPAPADYVEGVAICNCPDGTKIKTTDCRWVDCPGTPNIPTEFTAKGGMVPKVTVEINFPLSAKEAKKVAVAACGIASNASEPPSPYENIISECSPAWSFLDEMNPCNTTQAYVCGNKTFASCKFGGQAEGFGAKAVDHACIKGLLIIHKEYQSKFIVANPLDLSQVKEFSKFRSCLGHDYSGFNDKGESESQRSMKQGGIAFPNVTKMNLYAPFNGTVIDYSTSPFAEGPEEEHSIEIIGDHSGRWFITFGHFTAKEGLGYGSRVAAGEFIGTSTIQGTLARDGVEVGLSMDDSTEIIKEQFWRGSLLDYMTDNVLTEYASYGLTPENTVITKEYRDAHPCDWKATVNPDDFVTLNTK